LFDNFIGKNKRFLNLQLFLHPVMCENTNCKTDSARAASVGHIKCLKYAHDNGFAWEPDTTMWAAMEGKLECLIYAHENGCPWHIYTSHFAASTGQIECLKYAHENGCPWHSYSAWNAAFYASENLGNIKCLEYIFENYDVSWEDANLEKDFEKFPKESQIFIDIVREEWKLGKGKNIKG
jgi:hypothetical protein